MSILIVDDSKDDRMLMRTVLSNRGFGEIYDADSSIMAFEILKKHRKTAGKKIKVILLDIMMPEIDGIEFLRHLQQDGETKDIPVIMVTGNDNLKNLEEAFASGAVDYVTKPFKKIELLSRISAVLRLKREMDQRKMHQVRLEKKNEELKNALNEIKVLRGFIPICASCKQIRDDKGYWTQVEEYIAERSEAKFTHGICPDCMERLYPETKKRLAS